MIRISPIVIFAALACLSSCSDDTSSLRTEFWRGEERRHSLETQIALASMNLEKELERARNSEAVTSAFQAVDSRRADLVAHKETLEGEIASLQERIERVRTEGIARIRTRRTGQDFPELVALDGRVYLDVSVRGVTDAGIEFRHRNGSARLSASELTREHRDFFAIDTATSAAAISRENRETLAYERWVDRRLESIESAAADAGGQVERRKPTKEKAIASIHPETWTSALDEPPRALGSGRRIYRPTRYRYYNYYPANPCPSYYPTRYNYRPGSVPIRGSVGSPTPRWGTTSTPYCPR